MRIEQYMCENIFNDLLSIWWINCVIGNVDAALG